MRNSIKAAMFAAITVILAQIAVPIPITPIPLTLGLVAVFLTGSLLSPAPAVQAMLIYLLLGAVGLPVFAGFKGGLGALFGPTGGFLLAYPVMAFIISGCRRLYDRGGDSPHIRAIAFNCAACVISLAVCYLFGSIQLAAVSGFSLSVAVGKAALPFIPLDLCKLAAVSVIADTIRRRVSFARPEEK